MQSSSVKLRGTCNSRKAVNYHRVHLHLSPCLKGLPVPITDTGRSQWPRGLRRWCAVAGLLRLRVWIPPVTWLSVCCECCLLSGRVLCVELITRPEESYQVRCAWMWSWSLDNEEALAHWGLLIHSIKVSCQWRILSLHFLSQGTNVVRWDGCVV